MSNGRIGWVSQLPPGKRLIRGGARGGTAERKAGRSGRLLAVDCRLSSCAVGHAVGWWWLRRRAEAALRLRSSAAPRGTRLAQIGRRYVPQKRTSRAAYVRGRPVLAANSALLPATFRPSSQPGRAPPPFSPSCPLLSVSPCSLLRLCAAPERRAVRPPFPLVAWLLCYVSSPGTRPRPFRSLVSWCN